MASSSAEGVFRRKRCLSFLRISMLIVYGRRRTGPAQGSFRTPAQAGVITPGDPTLPPMSRLLGPIGAVAIALAVAGCGGGKSGSGTLGYLGQATTSRSLSGRPCGNVTAGRQWHVTASPSVSCGSARRLVTAFYSHRCPVGSARHPNASCTISGYSCLEAPSSFKGGFIWCVNEAMTRSVKAT
jgi:hypothetical protein